MDPTIEILISSPVSSEAKALCDIVAALRPPALVLANFEVSSAGISRQIDFVVVTKQRAELIELKTFTAPIKGGMNGPWLLEKSPGVFEQYPGTNPWEQARDAKFALSDAMHDFVKQRPEMPKPAQGRFYGQFDASVTVYPRLMPGSKVPRGNFKAWIRSFQDTLGDLVSRPLPVQPAWDLHHWRRFATEYLGLKPATLASAIDIAVFVADQAFHDYVGRLQGPVIAALLKAQEGEMAGENLVKRLITSRDVLLLGRSGLGKSFHIDHYRRRCHENNEMPLLLYAGHYQRDLNRAIHKSTGQFTRLAPAELLDAAKRLGMRPVLIVDGWNDCPDSTQGILADDLAAFQLRYDARLVVASQTIPEHPQFAGFVKIELAPLRQEHKQAIFAFHAGQPDTTVSPQCLEPFSTAFDLRIAGRPQRNGTMAETRAEVYDAYLRGKVPAATGRSLLRKLAWFMGEEFKPVLPVEEYERVAERFAEELCAPIPLVDELLTCGVLNKDAGVVAFEHPLLKDYFRSQYLVRNVDAGRLTAKLREARYSGLCEFVAPSLTNASALRDLLATAAADLLARAFQGWLGPLARRLVREQCRALLTRCRDRLAEVTVEAAIGGLDDGRRFISAVRVPDCHCASGEETKFCAVVASNLDDPDLQTQFLELLEMGEWALVEASARTARELSLKPLAVWRRLVDHCVIMSHNEPVHPLLLICHCIRGNCMWGAGRPNPLPVRDVLLQKMREGRAGTLPLLLLMFDLRHEESTDPDDILAIVRQAWGTGISAMRTEALDFMQSTARVVHEAGSRAEAAAIELLEQFDVSNDIFLSTQWLDTRSSFSGFEPGIDSDDALDEFRRVLAMAEAGDDPLYHLERETNPTVTYPQYVAGWASAKLGKIFEDVFQGVYFEAYERLTNDEKGRLLALALQDGRVEMFGSWYLTQLISLDNTWPSDVLLRYGGRIVTDAFSAQDSVAMFIMANEAWARLADAPIPYRDVDSAGHQAWAIIGESVFWMNRPDDEASRGRLRVLFDELTDLPAELPDVFKQLGHSHKGMGNAPTLAQLLKRHPDGIRRALQQSLKFEGRLTSVFPTGEFLLGENFQWIISCLGEVGNNETITLLRPYADSQIHGKDAIQSIEQIQKREATVHRG